MSNVSLYIASSIDGYIATKDGGVDWLSFAESGSEDYGYNEFYNKIDALLMGRKTYDFCNQFEHWPYEGKHSFVFTSQNLKTDRDDIEFLSMKPAEEMHRIKAAGYKNIWLVGGGMLNTEFLNADLIDEIILSIIPVVLGEGIPLFPNSKQQPLKLVDSKLYSSGLVQLFYSLKER